jgi:hypothetical protein
LTFYRTNAANAINEITEKSPILKAFDDNRMAGSWLKWGQKLAKPRLGAIVVLTWKGTRADHVAFVDKENGEWKLLGGNQTPSSGIGGAIAVSLRPFTPKTAMAYIWP